MGRTRTAAAPTTRPAAAARERSTATSRRASAFDALTGDSFFI